MHVKNVNHSQLYQLQLPINSASLGDSNACSLDSYLNFLCLTYLTYLTRIIRIGKSLRSHLLTIHFTLFKSLLQNFSACLI